MLLTRCFTAIAVAASLLFATACGEPTSTDRREGVLWEVEGVMSTAPVIVDSIVVTGMWDGRLIARHRLTGRSLWQQTFSGEFGAERLLHVGDMLIVPHMALHGVDVRTGARRWTFQGRDQSAGVLTPTLAGDTVFVAGFSGGTTAALNARTGVVYWQRDLPQTVYNPSVSNDLVIYPLRHNQLPGHLVALDRYTGAIRWQSEIPDSVGFPGGANSGGAIMGDRTIVATSIGRVLAFRLADGAILWEQGRGNPPATTWYLSQPLRVDSLVVVLRSGDGWLEGRSPADGAPRWRTSLGGGSLLKSPIPCGMYLCLSYGRVWIFDQQGKILWADGGGSGAIFLSNVTVSDDGIMYAGVNFNQTNRGYVRAFRPPVQIGATP